jgi:hypothetical protein
MHQIHDVKERQLIVGCTQLQRGTVTKRIIGFYSTSCKNRNRDEARGDETPVFYAARLKRLKTLDLLIAAGAVPAIADIAGAPQGSHRTSGGGSRQPPSTLIFGRSLELGGKPR